MGFKFLKPAFETVPLSSIILPPTTTQLRVRVGWIEPVLRVGADSIIKLIHTTRDLHRVRVHPFPPHLTNTTSPTYRHRHPPTVPPHPQQPSSGLPQFSSRHCVLPLLLSAPPAPHRGLWTSAPRMAPDRGPHPHGLMLPTLAFYRLGRLMSLPRLLVGSLLGHSAQPEPVTTTFLPNEAGQPTTARGSMLGGPHYRGFIRPG